MFPFTQGASVIRAVLSSNPVFYSYSVRPARLFNPRFRMPGLSKEEIQKIFELSTDFNDIFEAFEEAIALKFDDIELYRLLFWNKFLSPDELCMFGDKLAKEFPTLAYDSYMWLANVFEATYAASDNYDLALRYFKKAALVKPAEPDPYLDAADCYEPDLNIPPIAQLIDFLKLGAQNVANANKIYQRLAYLYELLDNDEMTQFYRRKANPGSAPPPSGLQPA
ncbi:MAG TPA: hypothetical protein VKS81_07020 [Bacteroidota bacterium]|nr:hypothetical protein [Bacteroidota bacterium]